MKNSQNAVKDHFDAIASIYSQGYYGDSPLSHLYQTRLKRVSELLGDLSGKNVLSVGSGPGMAASIVLAQRRPFYGVDISLQMLKECRKQYPGSAQLALSAADMGRLPFRDASFNCVLCLGAIEYAQDIQQVLDEISRVLDRDGILIVSMQNKNGIYRWWDIHVYRSWLVNWMKQILARRPEEKPLETIFGFVSFRKLLAASHFDIAGVIFYDFNVFLRPLDKYFPKLSVKVSRRLESLSRYRLGALASGYILKCIHLQGRGEVSSRKS